MNSLVGQTERRGGCRRGPRHKVTQAANKAATAAGETRLGVNGESMRRVHVLLVESAWPFLPSSPSLASVCPGLC